ncbi:hypothetical protein COSO111634_21695 [Corallococcus soli]
MLLSAPMLGLLLMPGPGQAREPNVGKTQDLGSHDQTERASTSPANVVGTVPDTSPSRLTQNHSVRQITPDEERMRQVTGPVVKQDGLTLYVREEGAGPVVPLDMSALEITRLPREGQQVVALYQVEGETNNVALSLQGEKME